MVEARRYLISGRVQGVGFRFFARDAARRENLSGFALNLSDGRVEVVVEGEQEAILRFERRLRNGPPGARIDELVTEPATVTGRAAGGFSIG